IQPSTLSLHDALPISSTTNPDVGDFEVGASGPLLARNSPGNQKPASHNFVQTSLTCVTLRNGIRGKETKTASVSKKTCGSSKERSEEHTSELQSRSDL